MAYPNWGTCRSNYTRTVMCEPLMPDVVVVKAHQNNCSYVIYHRIHYTQEFAMVGGYMENLQIWGVGACPEQNITASLPCMVMQYKPDPPKSGQPLDSGQITCPDCKTNTFQTSKKRTHCKNKLVVSTTEWLYPGCRQTGETVVMRGLL